MKVTIGATTYTAIKNLSFAPEIDIAGSEVPINEFEVDIITNDAVNVGQFAYLYDDLDNLWAKYWIIYAEHEDAQIVHLKAQSQIKLLERRMLPAVMYSAEPLSDVLDDIFDEIGTSEYTLDSSLSNATISGFCPNQSCKTRLQWVCFVSRAYIKSFFSDKIEILPVDETETFIPIDKTYWKPSISYTDYVTRVRARAYTFTQGTPSTTDEWVSDGTDTYIVTSTTVSVANPDAPVSALTHEVTIDDIYLIDNNNISAILSYLATYYFKRMQLDISVINNAEYIPGDKVIAYQDEYNLVSGYIKKCEFTTGVQAKARISLAPVEVKESATITVRPNIEIPDVPDIIINDWDYLLPTEYNYEIELPWIDTIINGHRYIMRPTVDKITGTVSQSVLINAYYEEALDYFENNLHIISVDGVVLDSEDESRVVIE